MRLPGRSAVGLVSFFAYKVSFLHFIYSFHVTILQIIYGKYEKNLFLFLIVSINS